MQKVHALAGRWPVCSVKLTAKSEKENRERPPVPEYAYKNTATIKSTEDGIVRKKIQRGREN